MVQSAAAIETDLKKNYLQGETIVVKISGNIIEPFLPEQVKFIRAGHVQEIPVIYELKKLDDNYYIWALAPKSPGNYTLILNDLTTTLSGSPKKVEFRQNFSIEKNLTDYSVSPGFIISEKDFSIQAQLYLDKDIKINVDYPSKREFMLKPGNNVLDFKIEGPPGIKIISVGKYSIPINILSGSQSSSINAPYSFAPNYLTKTFSVNEKNKTARFSIVNTGEKEIKDIQIIHGDYFTLYPTEKITLKAKESKEYTLTILKSDGIRLQDQISARSGEWNIVLPIKIDFEEINDTPIKKNEDYRCSELGGKICTDSQKCIGTLNSSQEGLCCIGSCAQKDKESENGGSIMGYILAILVVAGLIGLYWKYKKTKPDQNPLPKKIKEAEKIP